MVVPLSGWVGRLGGSAARRLGGSAARRFDGSTVRRFDGSTVRRFEWREDLAPMLYSG